MIASWMLYAVAVGALLTVAALGLDRVAIARRRPTRIVWFTALSLSIMLPIARAAARLAPEPTAAVRVIPFTITVQSPAMAARASLWNRENVDRALLVGWCALSALLLLRLTRSVLTLRRTRGTWSSTDIDGTSVRLSKNVGPAVIGLRSMDVVLPEWILSLDAPLRAIVSAARGRTPKRARSRTCSSAPPSLWHSCPGTRRCGFRRGGFAWLSSSIATRACSWRIRPPSATAC